MSKDVVYTDPRSELDNPKGFDAIWAVGTVLSAVAMFFVGKVLGKRSSTPVAMMATTGDVDKDKSAWDDRISLMDQLGGTSEFVQEGQATTKFISEADFANLIVKAMEERYGADKVERVVKSFRQTEAGEEFSQVHGDHPLMKQEASSYVEGLTARPVWENPAAKYPWAAKLQEGWKDVVKELEEVIALGEDELRSRGSMSWCGAQDVAARAYGEDWKTLGLCDRGYWDETNTRLFPNTCRLLRASRAPIMEAFFAKMPPGAVIKPHTDNTNFVLTAHLGLKIPKGEKTWINVGDKKNVWKEGEVILMDTSYLHEAFNESEEDRYVLILRVWHPELTAEETQAITFLFDCLDDSEIITNPDGQTMYDMMKAHLMMQWNSILGPGDTEEESAQILAQMEAKKQAMESGDKEAEDRIAKMEEFMGGKGEQQKPDAPKGFQ